MGILKLGGMTLGSLFKKKETLKYPFKTKEPYKEQKGIVEHDDLTKCNLCGICSKKCPASAITVDRKNKKWSINHFQCVQCGYCISSCPKKCLIMNPQKPSINTKISEQIIDFSI